MSLRLRHADGDRTWCELGWLEVSALPFFSGIYFANTFDRDAIPPFQVAVKDTYSSHVMSQARTRIQSIAESVAPPPPPPPQEQNAQPAPGKGVSPTEDTAQPE
jgi:hypothetical protein